MYFSMSNALFLRSVESITYVLFEVDPVPKEIRTLA